MLLRKSADTMCLMAHGTKKQYKVNIKKITAFMDQLLLHPNVDEHIRSKWKANPKNFILPMTRLTQLYMYNCVTYDLDIRQQSLKLQLNLFCQI